MKVPVATTPANLPRGTAIGHSWSAVFGILASATMTAVTVGQAKDFIVAVIIDQAQRDGVAISGVERKMLSFSETEESGDFKEANEAFDREYDQGEYEKKIASIIRNAIVRLRAEDAPALERWVIAVKTLDQGDHYLSVMIKHPSAFVRPPRGMLKLWATGTAICLAFVIFAIFASHC